MRSITLGILLLATPLAAVAGQSGDSLVPGVEIQFRARGVSGWARGRLAGLRNDSLVLIRTSDTLAVGLDVIRRLELNHPGGFRHKAARRGALWGLGTGTVLTMIAASDDESTPTAALIAGFAALGYLSAGSGSNGRTGGMLGALVGAPIGIVIYSSDYEPCRPNALLCFDRSFYVVVGAMAGAGMGAIAGTLVGALIPGDHWERVSKDRLRLSLAPSQSGGVSIGAAFKF